MGVFKVEPVKITFFQRLFGAIGRMINADVMDKLACLEKEVWAIKHEAAENAAKQARVRILRFGDEIYNNVLHTREHFNQILQDITEYEHYCDTHAEFENDMTAATVQRIKEVYYECLKNKTFIDSNIAAQR